MKRALGLFGIWISVQSLFVECLAQGVLIVKNNSTEQVQNIYLSSPNSTQWGADQLGDDIINPSQQLSMSIRSCDRWDIRVVFRDNTFTEIRSTELCGKQFTLIDKNRVSEAMTSRTSQPTSQTSRTFCAVSIYGGAPVGCGLSYADCSRVVAGLAGMTCR
jgi:hypothetical protein